jgi:hypothetical protein
MNFILCHCPPRWGRTTIRKNTFVGGYIGKLAYMTKVSDVVLGLLVINNDRCFIIIL